MKWPIDVDQEQCDLLRDVTNIAMKYRKAIEEARGRLSAWCDMWKPIQPSEYHWIKQARDILAEALKEEDDDGTRRKLL